MGISAGRSRFPGFPIVAAPAPSQGHPQWLALRLADTAPGSQWRDRTGISPASLAPTESLATIPAGVCLCRLGLSRVRTDLGSNVIRARGPHRYHCRLRCLYPSNVC